MTELATKRKRPPPKLSEDAARKLLDDLEHERVSSYIELEDALADQRSLVRELQPGISEAERAGASAANELAEWDARLGVLVPGVMARQDFDEERRELSRLKDEAQALFQARVEEAQRRQAPLQQRIEAKRLACQKKDDAWTMWIRYADAANLEHGHYWTPEKGPPPRSGRSETHENGSSTPPVETAREAKSEAPAPSQGAG